MKVHGREIAPGEFAAISEWMRYTPFWRMLWDLARVRWWVSQDTFDIAMTFYKETSPCR